MCNLEENPWSYYTQPHSFYISIRIKLPLGVIPPRGEYLSEMIYYSFVS